MSVAEEKPEQATPATSEPADVRLERVTKRFDDVVAVDGVGIESLEEAALDLAANEWTTFRKVTLPLIAPAILAGALLSFALSVDDFVITYFNSGAEVTLPLYVWGAARVGAPPQVNVIATAIFAVALGAMLANLLIQNRRTKGAAA